MSVESYLYSASQVRELDRRAIKEYGIAGSVLMERAATAAWRALRARFPRARCIAVVCGSGNNGGDGFVLARLAHQAGFEVRALTLGKVGAMAGDAAAARASAEKAGVTAQPFVAKALNGVDVVVDALLGTGLERPLLGEWHAAVESINASPAPVLAIDIPSGLHSDTGAVLGVAVRAEVTMSFIGLKVGLFTGAGREYAGEILLHDLDVPADTFDDLVPLARRLNRDDLRGLLPRRSRQAHKGSFGHVLVVGGGVGMPGAVRLSGEAACRTGAGLVTLATHPAHAASVNTGFAELLAYPVKTAKDVKPLAARADVMALGPGLSQTPWAKGVWTSALSTNLPLVVDADALNLLAEKPRKRKDWILSPHPGEAARLLKKTVAAIQQDRFAAVRAIAERYGGVCVLKGSGTLIAAAGDDVVWLCDAGNPGMASGGSGDVLTGVMAALRAQGLGALVAAKLGVWLHATAGDIAAGAGEIGMVAQDLIANVRTQLNGLTS